MMTCDRTDVSLIKASDHETSAKEDQKEILPATIPVMNTLMLAHKEPAQNKPMVRNAFLKIKIRNKKLTAKKWKDFTNIALLTMIFEHSNPEISSWMQSSTQHIYKAGIVWKIAFLQRHLAQGHKHWALELTDWASGLPDSFIRTVLFRLLCGFDLLNAPTTYFVEIN